MERNTGGMISVSDSSSSNTLQDAQEVASRKRAAASMDKSQYHGNKRASKSRVVLQESNEAYLVT